jgi:hypothetical protein
MADSICNTIAELETVVSVGFAAFARVADPEKLQNALDYIRDILDSKNAKLTDGERRGIQFLSDIIELRAAPLEVNAAKPKPSHLQIVE